MDGHYATRVVRHQSQSVARALETRRTTVGQLIRNIKRILRTQRPPIVLLLFGQHEDEVQLRVVVMKTLQRAHEHGTAADRQELLGYITAHARALATGDDDHIVLLCHHFDSIR